MKKTDEMAVGGYVNDALTCSSLDITNPKDAIPHGSQSGSDEFICECLLITKLLPFFDGKLTINHLECNHDYSNR